VWVDTVAKRACCEERRVKHRDDGYSISIGALRFAVTLVLDSAAIHPTEVPRAGFCGLAACSSAVTSVITRCRSAHRAVT
jgi:hypothetical protein